MGLCSGEYLAKFAEKLISAKHQVHEYGLDLTVANIYAVKKAGDIDFGGSELKEAMVEEVPSVKRSVEDSHGWWTLAAGQYIVEFNEKVIIPDGCSATIQPRYDTLSAGVFHPTITYVSGEKVAKTVLVVGKSGFNIKENARISVLRGAQDNGGVCNG